MVGLLWLNTPKPWMWALMVLFMVPTIWFHMETGDPLYDDYPGFWAFIGASIIGFGIGQPISTLFSVYSDKQRRIWTIFVMKRAQRYYRCRLFQIITCIYVPDSRNGGCSISARPDSGFTLDDPDGFWCHGWNLYCLPGWKESLAIWFYRRLLLRWLRFSTFVLPLFTEDFINQCSKVRLRKIRFSRSDCNSCGSCTWYCLDTGYDESR